MADEKLIKEISRVIGKSIFIDGSCLLDSARDLLDNPALIKRMAEGVGLEVKEKPARFVVLLADPFCEWCRVKDGESGEIVVWLSAATFPDALERCHAIADEKNSKERG